MGIAARILFACALVLVSCAAHAQGYPNKPITVIVPFGPDRKSTRLNSSHT